jgi:hypothetical protein
MNSYTIQVSHGHGVLEPNRDAEGAAFNEFYQTGLYLFQTFSSFSARLFLLGINIPNLMNLA